MNAKSIPDAADPEPAPEYHPHVVTALKAMIVLFEAICAVGQYLVIDISGQIVELIPETTPALWPYRIAGVLGIACFEVALAAVWPLLTLVRERDIFSGRAIRWTDLIVACACAEGALVLFVLVFSGLDLHYVDASGRSIAATTSAPLFAVTLIVALLLIAAFVMLMLVMRSLLTQAIAQRRELEAVI
ncbi:hypothetical protein G1C96_0946 [Bifidobacterium sp. DSM 109958]|uniref:DUF2975 domain-containing protein n=1 Tax=Bifidobacterium moraviense TaxID=2675323 RepID=A0A7Y0HYF8_9BIFI|nr:DUF2975 domain-containing protein [Bifidobacterium sp. DSM 109958]NMN00367.1 hypothetical protein [Bifidobacterium sp. DSM 109958]